MIGILLSTRITRFKTDSPSLPATAWRRRRLGDGYGHGPLFPNRLKETKDGPTLEHGFLGFDGKALRLPLDTQDKPKREYLEERYETFRAVG